MHFSTNEHVLQPYFRLFTQSLPPGQTMFKFPPLTTNRHVICTRIVGASIARPLVVYPSVARTANGRPYKVFVKEKDI